MIAFARFAGEVWDQSVLGFFAGKPVFGGKNCGVGCSNQVLDGHPIAVNAAAPKQGSPTKRHLRQACMVRTVSVDRQPT